MSHFLIETSDIIWSYYSVMGPEDIKNVALSFSVTVVLGVLTMVISYHAILRFFLYRRRKNLNIKNAPKKNERVISEDDMKDSINKRGSENSKYQEDSEDNKKNDNDTSNVKRHIPTGAQAIVMERAKRQLQEGQPDKALISFLSLLYVSVESKDENALPSQLTECLRGASECYQMLGQTENAVKFLQAERRILEEVVVIAANSGNSDTGRKKESILQALFQPTTVGEGKADVIHKRCNTLSQVAQACTRLGRHDVALAYYVKAAAMKHKITGKPLDINSQDTQVLAEAVRKLQQMSNTSEVTKGTVTQATNGEVGVEDPFSKLLNVGASDDQSSRAEVTSNPVALGV
eukprot:Tbor_TRINITY_DN5432_c0_g4::TRINITY_DN5432_c0_g4_i1::g.24281::m.24281